MKDQEMTANAVTTPPYDRYGGHSKLLEPGEKASASRRSFLRPYHIGLATQAVAQSSLKLGYIASLAMTSAMTTISRQDLFDKVWSSPVTRVAAEFGVSDTAVRKMCRRHGIPVPSRGYWAQVAAGRTFPRPKLEPASRARLETVRFVGAGQPSPEVKAVAERLKEKAREGERPAEQGAVGKGMAPQPHTAADDQEIHPLVVRTRDKLAGVKAGEMARVSGKGLFTVVASAEQADRIARLLTLLLRAMEARGWSAKGDDKGLFLAPDDEPIRFELAEQTTRTPHQRTDAETAALKRFEEGRERAYRRGSWSVTPDPPSIPEWDYEPTGQLVLTLDCGGYRHSGMRRKFSDGKTQRLEGMVDRLMEALTLYAAGEKVWRERQEKERLERAEAEKRRKEADRRQRLASKRLEFLELQLQRFRRATEVEAFIALAEAEGPAEDVVGDFMAWAKRYATSLREDISQGTLRQKLQALDLMNDEVDIDGWRAVDHSLDPEMEHRTRYLEPKVRPGAPWWYWRR